VTANSSEDAEVFLLRFYEWAGEESDIKLQLLAVANSATETGMIKNPVTDLAPQEASVRVQAQPFEFETVRTRFASKLSTTPAERSSN
jgi:alpha-mannosidase